MYSENNVDGEWVYPYADNFGGYPSDEVEVISADSDISIASTLPSSVDLSTDLAFPCIGHQGDNMNSCGAWASTYYQFTYEVNKLRGTAARQLVNGQYENIDENVYSPTWTYNYVNGGGNNGTYFSDNYRVLEYQGAMTLADMPYNPNDYDFDEWCTNEDKLLGALEYRGKRMPLNATSVSSIKQALSDGHVVTVWTDPAGWGMCTNDGQCFVVRGGNSFGGHFMTIVGYDDNVDITVNDVTLEGAFKVADSYGTNHANNGFIWFSYDALNSTSAYGTEWQSDFTVSRASVFSQVGWLNVYECAPTFVGYLQYVTTQKYDVSVYANSGTSASGCTWSCSVDDTASCYTTPPKTLIFDFFSPSTTINVGSYMSSNWTVRLKDTSDSGTAAISMHARVVDNLGNKIAPASYSFTSITNGELSITMPVNLAKGRVTAYDNAAITSADSQLVLDFLTLSAELSYLQVYLADYNSDGKVSMSDVVAMNSDIAARDGETYAITDYIDEWGCSLADVIEEQYDMPIEQYVAQNYAELSALNAIPADMNVSAY